MKSYAKKLQYSQENYYDGVVFIVRMCQGIQHYYKKNSIESTFS